MRLSTSIPDNRRLILIFGGWAADAASFGKVDKEGYDVAAVFDYDRPLPERFTDFQMAELQGYEEIVVVAWSFGVVVADRFDFGRLPVTLRIALNGTTFHIDDTRGIPSAIFTGTHQGLDESNLQRFIRRMCGGTALYRKFMERRGGVPFRNIETLQSELQAFAEAAPKTPQSVWDMAVISDTDAIFPTAAQLNAWTGTTSTEVVEGTHLPDFQVVIDRFVKDKQLVASRFGSAQKTYTDAAETQAKVAKRLWQIWEERLVDSVFDTALEVGCGDGTFTRIYTPGLRVGILTLWDIADCSLGWLDRCFSFCRCDAETTIRRIPAESYDLILSSSTLQWMNSPRTFLAEVHRVLRPDGYCLLSVYGKGTFGEVASLTGLSLNYPDESDLRRWCEGFEIVVLENEEITQLFPSPMDALAHVRATGVNALSRKPMNVKDMRHLLASYPLTADGEAPITFRPFYLLLHKP